ncbi:hypothetical protein ACOQFV_03900 [Nocardiopsis changdeensis]|uniref:Uncharacterized protein n=1 Tax=Nocardiopsis changdeensis TaxID=2831969 RepID=A0ABX8BNW3_9ACTN|nr:MULTISPECIES: hypothetical protein [Nocardiopsis]QUX22747.1 hypothetical protein KGD84_31475 [Nocardiopsis changdeensis]QYX38690.1 hypothetical protein K1J57_08850 [Nocardiopsis sp. MT53]
MTRPRWNVVAAWSAALAYVFFMMWFFTSLPMALGQTAFLALVIGLGRWNRRSKCHPVTSSRTREPSLE